MKIFHSLVSFKNIISTLLRMCQQATKKFLSQSRDISEHPRKLHWDDEYSREYCI